MRVYRNLTNRESSINQQNRDCHSETVQMFLCSVHLLRTLIRVALEGRKSSFAEQLRHTMVQEMTPLSDCYMHYALQHRGINPRKLNLVLNCGFPYEHLCCTLICVAFSETSSLPCCCNMLIM